MSLELMINREGYFYSKCNPITPSNSITPLSQMYFTPGFPYSSPVSAPTSPVSCAARNNYLTSIYTLGVSANIASYIIWGIILDWAGPRITSTSSILLATLGNILLSIANDTTRNVFHLAIVCVGVGGIGVHLSAFHLANSAPIHHIGMASAIIPCMFNISAIVYPFMNLLNMAGMSMHTIFAGFTCVLLVAAVALFYIQEWKTIMKPQPASPSPTPVIRSPTVRKRREKASVLELSNGGDSKVEGRASSPELITSPVGSAPQSPLLRASSSDNATSIGRDTDNVEEEGERMNSNGMVPLADIERSPSSRSSLDSDVVEEHENDLEPGDRFEEFRYMPNKHDEPWYKQMLSWWFLLTLLFIASILSRNAFWQGNLARQLRSYGATSDVYAVVISWFPALIILLLPVLGAAIDHYGLPFVLAIGCFFQVVYTALALVPNIPVQFITGPLAVLSRAVVMTGYFSCVAIVCGYKTFGKVSGTAMAFGGLVNFSSIPLSSLINNQFKGDFFWVQVVELIWGVPLCLYPWYLWKSGKEQHFRKSTPAVAPSPQHTLSPKDRHLDIVELEEKH